MIIHSKIILGMLISTFAVSVGFTHQKYCIETGNADGVEYRVVSVEGGQKKEIDLFHQLFVAYRETIFNEYDLAVPVQQRIRILCGAAVFHDLTGLFAKNAGVYLPDRCEFVFQRPSALKQKGILDIVIRHELLHCAIALMREKAGIGSEKAKSLYYLEESFCTAVYPAGDYDTAKGRKILSGLGDPKKIKNYLDQNMRSGKERELSEAYAAAFVYGSDLIAKYGKTEVFRQAVGASQ